MDGCRRSKLTVAGKEQDFPLVADANHRRAAVFAGRARARRGAAGFAGYRNACRRSRRAWSPAPTRPIAYRLLGAANPRPGSATLVSFRRTVDDWQKLQPFRLALAGRRRRAALESGGRVLTVSLPKAAVADGADEQLPGRRRSEADGRLAVVARAIDSYAVTQSRDCVADQRLDSRDRLPTSCSGRRKVATGCSRRRAC